MDESAPSDIPPQKGSASGPCRSFRTTFHIGKLCSNRGKVIGKVIAHRDRTRSRLDGSRFGMSSSSSFNSNHDVNGPRSDVSLQSVFHRCTTTFCRRAGRFLQATCQSGRTAARCAMPRMFIDNCTYLTVDARAFWTSRGTPMGSSARCAEVSFRRCRSPICRSCRVTWTALRWRLRRRKRGVRLRPYRSVPSFSFPVPFCVD